MSESPADILAVKISQHDCNVILAHLYETEAKMGAMAAKADPSDAADYRIAQAGFKAASDRVKRIGDAVVEAMIARRLAVIENETKES
jgi:hypothetical protein